MTLKLNTIPFAQKPKLTEILKNLVRSYPKGVGIIHEFIQNADDAVASEIWIVFDERTHESKKIGKSEMEVLQGPSLVIYNDAIFSEEDWDRIQDTGKSGKTLDASKTGRFGQGFNAVYNITDFPGVLTRDRLGYFDPHGATLLGSSRDDPGMAWSLDEYNWEHLRDLFSVFNTYGLQENAKFFKNTLFRLPLRSQNKVGESEISKQTFSRNDFNALVTKLLVFYLY
jgi:sacsin